MSLELAAVRWLRWEKRCPIVLCERSPREWFCGEPDALGITQARMMIEIEIKRSISDLRADAGKLCRRNRQFQIAKQPKLFYYLVPEPLLERALEIAPEWAGVMFLDGCQATVSRRAPVNSESQKLTVRECLRLVHKISNHSISLMERCEQHVARWREGHYTRHDRGDHYEI